ncbi:hypothetical protein SASPL_127771 [Salvia splendens]|uniref:Uncharacterized protein n=1 Tax=Salvia splendens TaxID=180675 RepID=A0A8X8XBG8_SALSN|nr:hypothetical protein SASPL_127771 [Salvia splendens]
MDRAPPQAGEQPLKRSSAASSAMASSTSGHMGKHRMVLASVDSVPDALLPVTRAPVEADWDRWFQGAQSSRSRRRWI